MIIRSQLYRIGEWAYLAYMIIAYDDDDDVLYIWR